MASPAAAAPGAAAARPAAGQEPRERLELDDFEVHTAGGEFDPVHWLNGRLAKSGVAFDKLDQHLSSLAMRCQLLCQDTSEAIEVSSNQLVAQLPTTGRDMERMRDQALRGRGRLDKVLDGLRDADNRKQSGLAGLADIDSVKTRVETACNALREVSSWERKVRDCEQLVHSGKLPAALTQLSGLKGALDAFRMLPEYSKKESQMQQLEDHLLSTARRKARQAVERNLVADLAVCSEVFTAVGLHGEPAAIAEAVFSELAERAWQGQDPRGSASATALAGATRATLEAAAQAFRERWPLLQVLDEAQAEAEASAAGASPTTPGTAVASGSGATASAVRAALAVLGRHLAACLDSAANAAAAAAGTDEEAVLAHQRASRAVALLAEYNDGLSAIASVAPVVETPALWPRCCREAEGSAEVLPWSLLREVATLVLLRPMQDDVASLSAQCAQQQHELRPSDAALVAESTAKRLAQLPAAWAKYIEDKGIARLAPAWLACVDVACEGYWLQWERTLATFASTLAARGAVEGGYDGGLLGECMQLHSMLHDTIAGPSGEFSGCQQQALQLAVRMNGAAATPLGTAIEEKVRGSGERWCDSLSVPSPQALRGAATLLQGISHEGAVFPGQRASALPASTAALAKVESMARELVTKCCVQPLTASIAAYSAMPVWCQDGGALAPPGGGGPPLPCVTSIGEHLFALVPQLERPHGEGAREQVHWLPAVLDSVVEVLTQQVLQIRQLSTGGARQLIADLEYLHKVAEALGSGGGAGASPGDVAAAAGPASTLAQLLSALEFLAAQQRRQQQCTAKGEPFVEAPREGPAAPRKVERALRAALGLAPAVGLG